MKLNIFQLNSDDVDSLRAKLAEAKLSLVKEVQQSGWAGQFYFSDRPHPSQVSWAEVFKSYFPDGALPKNLNHFAVFLFVKDDEAFALSYGKAHFYLRPFCNFDFGIELAKRIANDEDIRQTSGKRFAGKRTKDIKSFSSNTPLIVESGESVDFLQASIINGKQKVFGKTGRFGTSALVTPDIEVSGLGKFLDKVVKELTASSRFPLPRTVLVNDPDEIKRYDELLVKELTTPTGGTEFSSNTFDLYGVDFVFPSDGKFTLRSGRSNKMEFDGLTMAELKRYIQERKLDVDEILKIRIKHEPDEGTPYTDGIKDCVDFLADEERVVLSAGRWLRFNQDYWDFLEDEIRSIEVEVVEDEFKLINVREPDFNTSAAIRAAGFEVADKNFDIFTTRKSTPVEAWDLRRGSTVYAVKFGDAQKLNYVCDQALNVLELMRNKAETKQIPNFDRYCLWLGYRVKQLPESIADTGSIILKQKIEAWARKANELGITPVIRLSQSVGACGGPGCVPYFTKKDPRRAYCSAGCGNRARVARHYRLHKADRWVLREVHTVVRRPIGRLRLRVPVEPADHGVDEPVWTLGVQCMAAVGDHRVGPWNHAGEVCHGRGRGKHVVLGRNQQHRTADVPRGRQAQVTAQCHQFLESRCPALEHGAGIVAVRRGHVGGERLEARCWVIDQIEHRVGDLGGIWHDACSSPRHDGRSRFGLLRSHDERVLAAVTEAHEVCR